MSFSQRSHQRSASCRKPIAGLGTAKCGYLWIHGPTMPLTGACDPLDQARDCVLVAVAPAADGQCRGLDRRKILADRAALPIGVATLMLQPDGGKERLVLQPVEPHVAPFVAAGQRRVRRPRRIGQHGGAPAHVLVEQQAALVVDVVGVAVVGRAERDDGLQRRRLFGGDLQRVEAAPGNAHHADLAAAPGLGGKPGDHIDGVLQFLLGIFVVHQPFGIAVAAHVDAHAA